MIKKSPPGTCYCSLWETNSQLLEEQGLPRGYCGFCELCGDLGHMRHYPGPVPSTGAWCDVCYVVQSYKAPDRIPGAWHLDAETLEDQFVAFDAASDVEPLRVLLRGLRAPRSALIVELPTKMGIDFFVKRDGVLDMEFSDHPRGLFGKGGVELRAAELALSTLMGQGDIRQAMWAAGIQLEYYEDEPDTGG